MASISQKLIRSQSQPQSLVKIVSHLCKVQPLIPTSHLFPKTYPVQSRFGAVQDEAEETKLNTSHFSSQFYPSFSFGVFLNSFSCSTGFLETKTEDTVDSDDPQMIWADSVKKKRKKKMNKHKLKKLRKRLRKKT